MTVPPPASIGAPAPADADADLFDIVAPLAAAGEGIDEIAVEIAAGEAEALARIAARLGLAPAAIWRAAWALLLARLAGVRRVRVARAAGAAAAGTAIAYDVPGSGDLAAWLIDAAGSRPGADGAQRSATVEDDPGPHSAWVEAAADEPADRAATQGGAALVWRAARPGVVIARFAGARIDPTGGSAPRPAISRLPLLYYNSTK